MPDLLWPGDERAGATFGEQAFLRALVRVEETWLQVRGGRADGLVAPDDLEEIARAAEAGGNPVIALVGLMRERGAPESLHEGLTSQDVVDTALVLCARDTAARASDDVGRIAASLADLADRHRADPMMGRTLTQHARPITFGLKAAHWLQGVLDARDQLRALRWPGQFGGPVGIGLPQSAAACEALGLDDVPPWHTVRTPFTRYADALATTTDALGHVADDVLVGARSEVGELDEPAVEGRGGSSSMPHKHNPVLSVLVRRAALTTPGLAAQLHLAAADTVDERPDGAWHTEWSTLALISRRTLVATSQAAELLAGLCVDTTRMAARVDEPVDQQQVDVTIDRVLARLEEGQ
jgi:3-carboxy-cis,cis-muconate cycloisomerase